MNSDKKSKHKSEKNYLLKKVTATRLCKISQKPAIYQKLHYIKYFSLKKISVSW